MVRRGITAAILVTIFIVAATLVADRLVIGRLQVAVSLAAR
jgi:hypothetical protein